MKIGDRFKYSQLAEQFRLASKEIYSRFGAMLIANSIIITLLGTKYPGLPQWFAIIVSLIGMVICSFWWHLNSHGIHYQRKYYDEAVKLEEDTEDFEVFRLIPKAEFTSMKRNTYVATSRVIIVLFMIIDVLLLVLYASYETSGMFPRR